MAGNPNGFVQASDFGNPKVLTGETLEAISGGQFVGVSGTTGIVSSDLSSYENSDVKFYVADSKDNVVGMAMNTVGANANLGVAVEGVVLAKCGGSVFAGQLVEKVASDDAVQSLSSGSSTYAIGRAYTAGASGGFALIHINP